MLASAVRSLIKYAPWRSLDAPVMDSAPLVAEQEAPVEVAEPVFEEQTDWPPSRLALVHSLWGPGFLFPGGEAEALRLARPLGVSNVASLLIVGVGSGGPASIITRNLGPWVTGLECDPGLITAAKALVNKAQLGKKITIAAWDPDQPDFAPKGHHHCLALEPLHGAQPEPILDGLGKALRPGGQLVVTELAAPAPLNLNDPTVRRWGELERRNPAHLVSPVAVTRMLGRVGLDVRIAEDISDRHLENAILGWKVMLRELGRKPSRQEAIPMVAEAEMWLLRRRLIRDGRLRMMRWHAMTKTPVT